MTAERKPNSLLPAATRRGFLGGTAAAAAGLDGPPGHHRRPASKGANERPGIGFIGTSGRCRAHINICLKLKDQGLCNTVAVCNVYRPRVEATTQKTGGKIYRNYRELLANKNVDAVCPRHARPAPYPRRPSMPCLAGKDVYCEKPLTHWSQMDLARQRAGKRRRTGRMVQVGTQYVADDAYVEIRKLIKDGVIGKIVHIQAGYFRRSDCGERMAIPDAKAKPGPGSGLGQFLGDAPRKRFHRGLAVLPVAALLGLRRRSRHRPVGTQFHAGLLHAGAGISRSG